MQEKKGDPSLDKFMASMMEDAAKMQQSGQFEEDSDEEQDENGQTIIDIEEQEEIEALKATKAAGNEEKASQQEALNRAREIFGDNKK